MKKKKRKGKAMQDRERCGRDSGMSIRGGGFQRKASPAVQTLLVVEKIARGKGEEGWEGILYEGKGF